MTTATGAYVEYVHLAKLAEQYVQANQPTTAARFFRLAGEQAAASYANDTARNFFDRAVSLSPPGAVALRYELLRAREAIHALQGNRTRQEDDLISLAQLADLLDDDRKRALVAMRMAAYKEAVGLFADAVSVVRLAVRLAELAGFREIIVQGRIIWGRTYVRLGDYDLAERQLKRALRMAGRLDQPELVAECQRVMGILALNRGDLAAARTHYEVALPLARRMQDGMGENYLLNNLGHIAQVEGRLEDARSYWEEALAGYRGVGDRSGQGMTLSNLGTVFMDLGQYAQAVSYHEASRALCSEIDLRFGEAMAMVNLGLAALRQGDDAGAEKWARSAQALAETTRSKRLEGFATNVLAQIQACRGQWATAATTYWTVLGLWHELGNKSLALEARAGLAAVALGEGDMAQAMAQVSIILAHLDSGRSLDGAESPLQILLTCYQVLVANNDPRAAELLDRAHHSLQARAALIEDRGARHTYLDNIPVHRQIRDAVGGTGAAEEE